MASYTASCHLEKCRFEFFQPECLHWGFFSILMSTSLVIIALAFEGLWDSLLFFLYSFSQVKPTRSRSGKTFPHTEIPCLPRKTLRVLQCWYCRIVWEQRFCAYLKNNTILENEVTRFKPEVWNIFRDGIQAEFKESGYMKTEKNSKQAWLCITNMIQWKARWNRWWWNCFHIPFH